VAIQLGFTYWGLAHRLFGTASIPAAEWLLILGAGAAVFLLVEMEKAIIRAWESHKKSGAVL
jgi:hypothetical protein